jgi:Ca2+-binding EF-hand superfamily protein
LNFKIEELKEAFKLYDVHDSGMIDIRDLQNLLKAIGQTPTDDEIGILIDQVKTHLIPVLNIATF